MFPGLRCAPVNGRRLLLLFGALVFARVAVVPLFLAQGATQENPRARSGDKTVLPGDVRRYQRIAEAHHIPYADVPVEYPPLTLAAIELVAGHDVRATTVRLMWTQLLIDLAVACVLAWGWGQRAALAYLVIGLPFLAYPFLYLRLDLLAVFLAVLAGALVRRRLPLTGGATFALACFAKLWPLAVMPALLVRRSWRAVVAVVVTGAAGLVAWVAWTGTTGVEQVVTFRGATGWQIESTVGAFVHAFGSTPARVESGAWRVGAIGDGEKALLGLAMVATVLLVWVAAARIRPRTTGVLDGIAPLTALAAFLVFSPILSPQYACWLVPYAAIAYTSRERVLAGLTLAAVALSTLGLFLVKEITWGYANGIAVVFARNGVLVALLVIGIVRLVGRSGRRMPLEPDLTEPAARAA